MAVNYDAPNQFKTDFLKTPETAQVRDVETMRIVPAETKLQEALVGIKQPELLAQESYYDGLESDWLNGRKYWFRDNGPITQEMLNSYCAEKLSYTGGSNFVGRKLPYTNGRIPIRCQYQMNLNLGAGGDRGSFGVSGPFIHYRDLLRITPLCQSFYSGSHLAHTNGTRCGIWVPPAGKGTLTR
jgi:hypothetical protein